MLRVLALVLVSPVLALGVALLPERPLPEYTPVHPAATDEPFEAFLARKLERARAQGVRPGNEERLVQRTAGQAPVAILYIHGFTASRAEGEAVLEPLAEQLSAHVYYLRLPGHGASGEALSAARYEQYLEEVEEAFHRVRPLGERLVLAGSSTGGLLCLWLAARHPEEVDALVLANPLLALADPTTLLLSRRLGMPLAERAIGEERDASWKSDPEGRKQPGYEEHWVTRYKLRALLLVDDLRRTLATDATLRAVRAPVLLLYYDAGEGRRDTVADVSAMHRAFALMNGASPHPLSREVAIADGNHILLSTYVRSDKARILAEARRFLSEALER